MAEYIERGALQAQLNRKKPGAANKRYTDGWNDAVLMFKSMVHSAKAADVAPVRHGRWVVHIDSVVAPFKLKCSECDWFTIDLSIVEKYKYCPNCGAKMDGGDDHV